MKIKISLPDCFIPEEKEFQLYCAIKLLRGKYVSKDEALKISGFPEDKFNQLFSGFEKRYRRICGDGYADFDFEEADNIAKSRNLPNQ